MERLPPLKTKRQVFVKVLFLKVGEIDTIKEKYAADIFIQARWREEKLDNRRTCEAIDVSEYWDPKLIFPNVLESSKHKIWHEVATGEHNGAFIVEKRRIKGIFSEKLELKEFPFDAQDLSLQISSELPASKLEIWEDDKEISAINVSCFVDEQEWCLIDFVETNKLIKTKEFSQNKQIHFPLLTVGFTAVRRAGYFTWNVIFIMSLITSVALATFSLGQNLPQNRLQLSIVLLLTGVTFKSVANKNLPKISYNTHLDSYILFSMIYMWIVCVWHAILTRFSYDTDLQETMDVWAFAVLCFVFFGFHVIYGGFIGIKYFLRRRILMQKETGYEKHAEKLFGHTWKTNRKIGKVRKRHSALVVPESTPELTFMMMNNGMEATDDK